MNMVNTSKNRLVDKLRCVSPEDFSGKEYSAFKQNFLSYGIDVVAHAHLMQKVRNDLIKEKISLQEFTDKYNLNFEESPATYEYNKEMFSEKMAREFSKISCGFTGTLKSIERDGVFIPEETYSYIGGKRFKSRQDAEIHYFNPDYGNCLDTIRDDENWELMTRKFIPIDLTNPHLIERGLKFARDIWEKYCIGTFQESQSILSKNKEFDKVKVLKASNLGREFIVFYSQFFA